MKVETARSVNGKVYLSDGHKVIECEAEKSIVQLEWKNYGDCAILPMKLLNDGHTRLMCKCISVNACNKPYGIWKWSKEKPEVKPY